MRWASALAQDPDPERAADEAAAAVRAALQGEAPDLLLLFLSPQLAAGAGKALARVSAEFPTAQVVGCGGGGVIGAGHEEETGPALSLTAAHLPGVRLQTFHVARPEAPALAPDTAAVLLFVDPFSCDAAALVDALDQAAPGALKAGGLAAGGMAPGEHRLLQGGAVHRKGAVGVALAGALQAQVVVAQGARPIGTPMFATRVDGHLLCEVDGRSPLDVVRALHEAASPAEQELMRRSLLLGVEQAHPGVERSAGELLVRNIVGVEPRRRALAVGAVLDQYQVVQFAVRDAQAADQDLRRQLERVRAAAGPGVAGGLLFSCTGRGQYLYGEADHDSRAFQEVCGAAPLGGFFCNGELGPVSGRTHLHGFTSVFALFRPLPQ